MADINNLDINKFSIDELLDLLDLVKPVTREQIDHMVKIKIDKYPNGKIKEMFKNAKNKLFKYLDDNNLETIFQNSGNYLSVSSNIIQRENTLQTESVFSTNIVAGNINPIRRKIQKKIITIRTEDRELFTINECKQRIESLNNNEIIDYILKCIQRDNPVTSDYVDYITRLKNNLSPFADIKLTPTELNEFIGNIDTDNLNKILNESDLYLYHELSNPSEDPTILSFDKRACKNKLNRENMLIMSLFISMSASVALIILLCLVVKS